MSRKKLLKYENLENFIPETIGDRINYIVADNKLTGTKFCDIVEISTGNLTALINDNSNPSAGLLSRIFERFNVNINWILTGKGEKYIKRGEIKKKIGIAENSTYIYKEGGAQGQLDDDPGIADLLESARRVLKSGNQVAFDALERNIRYFSHAIKTEKRLKIVESRLEVLEKHLPQNPEDENTEKKVM